MAIDHREAVAPKAKGPPPEEEQSQAIQAARSALLLQWPMSLLADRSPAI
ncbi:hypothetical protein NKH24_19930 [Mesorhizobium sp. M1300]